MATSEDFCLKWNDHHSIFFSLAESLCRSSQLTDVTLATSDQTFPAHKLVLSVCSSFFRDLFSKPELSTVNQSVVYLKDVSSKQLELLLSYMYRGEINVEEQDLVKLLQTAKGLGVKGLSEVDDQNAVNLGLKTSQNSGISENNFSSKKPKEEYRKEHQENYEDIIEVAAPPKAVDYDPMNEDTEVVEPNIESMNSGMEDIAEEGAWYEDGGGFMDGFNGYDDNSGFVPAIGGKRAAENAESPLNCPQCPKTFASTWHLKRHVQTHSKEKRFKCELCGKFFSRNDNLKSHQKSVHGLVVQSGGGLASSGSSSLAADY